MSAAEPAIAIEASDRPEGRFQATFAIRLATVPRELRSEPVWGRDLPPRLLSHVDLLNGLYSTDPPRTYALRYLALPGATGFASGRVEIGFLGTIFGDNSAEGVALGLCRETLAQLASIFPDHVWEVAGEEDLALLLNPFDWGGARVAAIERRVSHVNMDTFRARPALGRHDGGRPACGEDVAFIHTFVPRDDCRERLVRKLLLHGSPVALTIHLTPTVLKAEEERAIGEAIAAAERAIQQGRSGGDAGGASIVSEKRAAALSEALTSQILRLQDAPYLLGITLASPEEIPRTLAEGIGVEISAPVGGTSRAEESSIEGVQRGGYDVYFPKDAREEAALREAARSLAPAPRSESAGPGGRLRFLVDAAEAVAAFRIPVATDEGLPGVQVRLTRIRPLPRIAALIGGGASESSLLVGRNHYLGQSEEVLLPEETRRQHVYVVGQTGTGKTTFLKSLILSDIRAGRGVGVIDPHGDLFREILASIPRERRDDVVVIDPADPFPVGINLLDYRTPEERFAIVREIKAIFETLLRDQYGDQSNSYTGPMFYQHLQMNLLLVMSDPSHPGTLIDVYRIFQTRDAWKEWVPLKVHDPQLEEWVSSTLPHVNYLQRGSEGTSLGEYVGSKLFDFGFDPRLRLMFGQRRSTVDFDEVFDKKKILLVNLAKGLLTEPNSRFLGMILLAKLNTCAMHRIRRGVEERPVFHLFVDEFQSLATGNFIPMLSEARKFGLSLTLANQFATQLRNQGIIESIFGNVGTLASFRLGRADAGALAQQFTPYFLETDLVNLPNWEACVKTTVAGETVPPFSMRTVLPQSDGTLLATEGEIRQRSRAKYAPRSRAEIEEDLRPRAVVEPASTAKA